MIDRNFDLLRFKAFFFDFDGVLVDSVEVKTQAFAQLFDPYGTDIRDKVVAHHRNHGGMTRGEKFRHYYKYFLQTSIDDQEIVRLSKIFSGLVIEKIISAPAVPGAEDFLQSCQGGVWCFVISGTPFDELREIVDRRGWLKYFAELCGAPVTKRDHLRILLKRYALSPKSCLFFGDALSDYDAAMKSGVPFIGILPDERAPLLKSVPDIHWVKDFNALMA